MANCPKCGHTDILTYTSLGTGFDGARAVELKIGECKRCRHTDFLYRFQPDSQFL